MKWSDSDSVDVGAMLRKTREEAEAQIYSDTKSYILKAHLTGTDDKQSIRLTTDKKTFSQKPVLGKSPTSASSKWKRSLRKRWQSSCSGKSEGGAWRREKLREC